MKRWRGGVLYEISLFGTGFIEDALTGRVYGFHKSMLAVPSNLGQLEGAAIRFQLTPAGVVKMIDLIDG